MDYWRCLRIKMSHCDMYKKSFYPEALDKFNVYDNLFLLLTMSALECFKNSEQWIFLKYVMPVLTDWPCFKSYFSYKFDQPEMIRDQAKVNLAGQCVWRVSGNYFEPCAYSSL